MAACIAACLLQPVWQMSTSVSVQIEAAHKVQPKGIKFVELAGDPEGMKEWIGPTYVDQIPLRWSPGKANILSVDIELQDGSIITLRDP